MGILRQGLSSGNAQRQLCEGSSCVAQAKLFRDILLQKEGGRIGGIDFQTPLSYSLWNPVTGCKRQALNLSRNGSARAGEAPEDGTSATLQNDDLQGLWIANEVHYKYSIAVGDPRMKMLKISNFATTKGKQAIGGWWAIATSHGTLESASRQPQAITSEPTNCQQNSVGLGTLFIVPERGYASHQAISCRLGSDPDAGWELVVQ
jgi:hypothetical protein